MNVKIQMTKDECCQLLLLGHNNLGRADDSVVKLVARLDDGQYGVWFVAFAYLLHHCFVMGGIKMLPFSGNRLAMMALQELFQLLLHHPNAFQERRGVGVFSGGFGRAADVIDDRQQIAQQVDFRVLPLIVLLAAGALAIVLQLRLSAEHLVARLAQFRAHKLHFLLGIEVLYGGISDQALIRRA